MSENSQDSCKKKKDTVDKWTIPVITEWDMRPKIVSPWKTGAR